jgi:hypothetical protein
MTPNAMGNAQAQQMAQLDEMSNKLKEKIAVQEKLTTALIMAKEVASGSTNELAPAIYHLADANLILAEYSLSELVSQSDMLTDAIKRARSPILTASLQPPTLRR